MPRKYGIKGKEEAFQKNKENWKTIVPDIKNQVLKELIKHGLDSPIIFLNLQPSKAMKLISDVPSLKRNKKTLLFYKKTLNGLSRYRPWLSTIIYQYKKK